MASIPAYEALASDLRKLGVSHAFGLMSDDTALLIAALDAMGVRFHAARHENNAIAMAEGYAAATGGLGIAVLGRGPATANGLHGATYAQRSGSRVLLVLGYPSTAPLSPDAYGPDTKAFDAVGVLRAAGLRTLIATDATTARRTLAEAVSATREGAVALLLPVNVQKGMIDVAATDPGSVAEGERTPRRARTAAIESSAALLGKSRRPLLLAGRGAHRAGARDALIRLADHVGAAMATTAKAKDMFRGHRLNCGVVGSFSHSAGRRIIDQADCIVAFGAALTQRTTSMGLALPAAAPMIHVEEVRANIGRWYPADVAVVADARLAAEQLLEALPARTEKPLHDEAVWRSLANFDPARDFEAAETPRTMDPRLCAIELDRLLPRDRNVVYDAGNMLQAFTYLSVPGPANVKMTSDFASVGMGFGTALGFAIGSPERPTVFVVGDGGLFMTLGELETVVREGVPLIIAVMNDCAYGAELHYLKAHDMPVASSTFPDVDFAHVAEAFGFQTATVRTLDELRALAPLLAEPDGPILLDCKINASVAAPFMDEAAGPRRN
ncbi:MAG: thiamine pyrophosphate-binding protein [Burkholderiales bacterium]|nr:thiamine pyrophosphate-binding protein [Burkholderiales bacterium]